MYIPKSKILNNKYTAGKEYIIAATGKEYIGYYNVLFNGTVLSGKINTNEPNYKLIPYEERIISKTNSSEIIEYDILTAKSFTFLKTAPLVKSHFPLLTENDYSQGFIMRYFSKNYQNQQIIEINQNTYNDLQQNDKYNNVIYNNVSLKWLIKGPKDYIYNENTKTIEATNRILVGIKIYLKNPIQFLRIS